MTDHNPAAASTAAVAAAQQGAAPSLAESQAWCLRLAKSHYENFTVASWLLPRRMRQHFSNIYAFCRVADDLADETGSPQQSLWLLDDWRRKLHACYEGRAAHPVFVALAETVRQFEIPRQPFEDLLAAFRQDQQVRRYQTIEEQLAYCRYSANPVGRLVLCLAGCRDERRAELSDHICTGLQLANFCQDVARDWDRGRIYLPLEVCRKFGLGPADFTRREASEAFRRMLASEVQRAEGFLHAGAPLVELMPRGFRVDVELFVRGGLATLEEIRRQDYDVWRCRPTLGRRRKASLIFACLTSRLLPQRRPR